MIVATKTCRFTLLAWWDLCPPYLMYSDEHTWTLWTL